MGEVFAHFHIMGSPYSDWSIGGNVSKVDENAFCGETQDEFRGDCNGYIIREMRKSDFYDYDENKGVPVNHMVLAVGYLQYNYKQTQASGLKESRYLQVADGWTRRSNRYINVHVGNKASHDEMVTLYFVYTYIQK